MSGLQRFRDDRARYQMVIDNIKTGRTLWESRNGDPMTDVTEMVLTRETARIRFLDKRIAEEEKALVA